RGSAVALVIMRHRPRPSLLHRQAGLRAVQRLNLAFLVDAKYQRVFRRTHIQPHHIVRLLYEMWAIRQFEGLDQMRLQAVGVPDTLYRGFADSGSIRHAAAAPMG